MNIKELAEQAGLVLDGEHWFSAIQQADVRNIDLERFAELIRDDERDKCAQDYLQDCNDAVKDARAGEREACAALCEELHNCETEFRPDHCAKAIRARGEE
jgi:hypothetical protein